MPIPGIPANLTARRLDLALLAAWLAGGVLAVAAPGQPFPGAPLSITLACALAWHAARFGRPRPRPAAMAVAGAVTAALLGLVLLAWSSERMPPSQALGASLIAALVGALACVAGSRRPD